MAASWRESTMWPSRMARTASEMGSLKSSPSTSTVKKPVMEPFLKLAGALEDARQDGEDGGRVALLAGWLAGGQSDFALRHGQARHRIHHQQHVGALVAEIFGDGQRHEAGADAQRGRAVGGGSDDHRARHALRAQVVVEEGAHLAVALADQAMTLTSAKLCRDMEPSSVLLPTPLPPKMPIRCPLPQGSRLSMARMPVASGSVMCSRSSGPGGAAYRS